MADNQITRFVRFRAAGRAAYGILDGETVHELEGSLFDDPPRLTGGSRALAEVELLVPLAPEHVTKVIGVTTNHDTPGERQPIPHPRWFAKLATSLNPHEGGVELPPGANNLNYEGELVVIIGKPGRHVSVEDAPNYVFGVSVGNDWSENTWYGERQGIEEPARLPAKGLDTWACLGPAIVTGLDYADLAMEIRLNGEVVAEGRTRNMRNSVARLVSYLSSYATLQQGDVIYTGTVRPPSLPGARRAMQDGDVVEVEIEQVGLLRNRIVATDAGPMTWPDRYGRGG